jgi:hypothetical protein
MYKYINFMVNNLFIDSNGQKNAFFSGKWAIWPCAKLQITQK